MAGRVTLGSHPGLRGKSSLGSVLLVAVAQGELVREVPCQAAFRGPHVAQLADMVSPSPRMTHYHPDAQIRNPGVVLDISLSLAP